VVDVFAQRLGKKVLWVPLPFGLTRGVARVPGAGWLLGLPGEALDYLGSGTTYSTTNTMRDLQGTGVECPAFPTYAGRLLDFMAAHPEIDAKAMV
jgi:hypothetical protein